MTIEIYPFNAFQENTVIAICDGTKECIIFDPGCSNGEERKVLTDNIKNHGWKPVRLINTHCHIDHVLGNKYISETFGLSLEAHEGEIPVLNSCVNVSKLYGIAYEGSPDIAKYIKAGDTIDFGEQSLDVVYTPGHSPASLCFIHHDSKQVIGGDVLFHGSIGRTDLPGGNFDTLIHSIKTQLMPLPDDYTVYPGHGPATTIGFERENNPFLQG
jgi:glyoxylase-like metal-dependent hydrolase (beta-lactamase superfamily II)